MSACPALINIISYIPITIVFLGKFCGIFAACSRNEFGGTVRNKNKTFKFHVVTGYSGGVSPSFMRNS